MLLTTSESWRLQRMSVLRRMSCVELDGGIMEEEEMRLTRSVAFMVLKERLAPMGFTPFHARGHCPLCVDIASSRARP